MSTNRVRYALATYASRHNAWVRHHAWVRFERRGNGVIWEARGMIIMNGSEFQYHSETPHYLAQVVPYNSTALPRMTPGQLRRLTMAVDEVEAFLRQQRNHYGYSSGCPECERLRRAHPLYRPRVPLTRARLAEHNNGFRMIYVPHPRAYEPASPSASPEPTATPGPSASPAPPSSAQDDDEDEDDDSADSVTIAATSVSRCCSYCSESDIERRRAEQRERRIQQQERRRDRAQRRLERDQRRLERDGRLRDLGGLPVRRLQ